MVEAKQKTKIHTVYKTKGGRRVPSVTTILGILDKPGLLDWAWKCGLNGDDYKAVRDQAADRGTIAHYLIECDIKGAAPDLSRYSPEDVAVAENAYLAWLDWVKAHNIEYVYSEVYIVSETYLTGGTIDLIAKHNGQYWLIDFKTSKGIYSEHKYQVAAYKEMWGDTEGGKQYPLCQVHILRLDKEDGSFTDHLLSKQDIDVGWQVFKYCREIYELKKGLSRG